MYKSKAQQRFFHVNKAKLELEGVKVDEWDKATGNKRLPERLSKKKDSAETLKRVMRKHHV